MEEKRVQSFHASKADSNFDWSAAAARDWSRSTRATIRNREDSILRIRLRAHGSRAFDAISDA